MTTRRLALIALLLATLASSGPRAETVLWSGTLAEGWHPDMEFLPVPGAPWDAVLVSFDHTWPPSTPNEVHVYHAAEHALVGAITGAFLHGEPVRLFYAAGRTPPPRAYFFAADVAAVRTRADGVVEARYTAARSR
jgi:hypothetical protein